MFWLKGKYQFSRFLPKKVFNINYRSNMNRHYLDYLPRQACHVFFSFYAYFWSIVCVINNSLAYSIVVELLNCSIIFTTKHNFILPKQQLSNRE